jgi:hypothetical protein
MESPGVKSHTPENLRILRKSNTLLYWIKIGK